MKKAISLFLSAALAMGLLCIPAGAVTSETVTDQDITVTITNFLRKETKTITIQEQTGYDADGWPQYTAVEKTVTIYFLPDTGAHIAINEAKGDGFPGIISYLLESGVYNATSPIPSSVSWQWDVKEPSDWERGLLHTIVAPGTGAIFYAFEGSSVAGSTPAVTETPAVSDAHTAKTGEKLDAWAETLVNQAIDAGLMPRSLAGADLTQNITRTQFADLAVTLYEAMTGNAAPVPAVNPFTDTNDEAVLKAYALGITSGISPTEFGAASPLTREAAATMLTSAYKSGGGVADAGGAAPFADDASISAWAKESVYFMSKNGVINGVGENTFAPQSMAQSQAALIMALRMFQNLKLG